MTVYILNWVPTKVVTKMPFELFKGWKHSLRHMCVWGCPSEVKVYNPQENKLDPRTINGYFVGYVKKSKGFRFYCPYHSLRFVESMNVKFLENDLTSGSDLSSKGEQPSMSSERLFIIHSIPQVQMDVAQPINGDP